MIATRLPRFLATGFVALLGASVAPAQQSPRASGPTMVSTRAKAPAPKRDTTVRIRAVAKSPVKALERRG